MTYIIVQSLNVKITKSSKRKYHYCTLTTHCQSTTNKRIVYCTFSNSSLTQSSSCIMYEWSCCDNRHFSSYICSKSSYLSCLSIKIFSWEKLMSQHIHEKFTKRGKQNIQCLNIITEEMSIHKLTNVETPFLVQMNLYLTEGTWNWHVFVSVLENPQISVETPS